MFDSGSQPDLLPLRASVHPHYCHSVGTAGGRRALAPALARSPCSGPRPGAADTLCWRPTACWDLRINQEKKNLFDDEDERGEVINQVCREHSVTCRNHN